MVKRKYLYVIGILVFAGTIVILIIANSNTHSEKSIREYFKPYPVSETLKKLSNSSPGQKAYAFRVYQQQDFKEAIVNFKYALIESPNDADIQFYLGICFLAINDYRSAKKQFEKLREHTDYNSAASWYLGLCNYLNNHKESAFSIFLELSQGHSEYAEPSSVIISEYFN